MKIHLKFEPRDIWIGVYWTVEKFIHQHVWHVYICIIPLLPIHVQWVRLVVSGSTIDTAADEEKDIAEGMIWKLWLDRQDNWQGGWYPKRWLFNDTHYSDPTEQAKYNVLQLKVFDSLVRDGAIDVCPTDSERISLGDSAGVSTNVYF